MRDNEGKLRFDIRKGLFGPMKVQTESSFMIIGTRASPTIGKHSVQIFSESSNMSGGALDTKNQGIPRPTCNSL